MRVKNFWVSWYPRDAFMGMGTLDAEEIGVLMQIINLIYSHNGPIANDAKHIGKNCGLTRSKCERIINRLIDKEHLVLDAKGKLIQKRCMEELKNVQDRREICSKNGKNGSEKRWQNQDNQEDNNSQAIRGDIANININTNLNKNTNIDMIACQGDFLENQNSVPGRPYDIDRHLSDEARRRAREIAPKWDQQHLMKQFNSWILVAPVDPDAAYLAWCAKYTKGKPPR